MARPGRIHGRQPDLRDLLLAAGIGEYNAVLSIPYMMFLPRTTDPYAQGVMQLIEGLQRLLNQRGAKLTVDGGLGVKTVAALIKYSGPRWFDKSWTQLYGDVLQGEVWEGYRRAARAQELETVATLDGWDYRQQELGFVGGVVDEILGNPLALLAAGGAAYWFFFHRKAKA